jgi:hypothetical protein
MAILRQVVVVAVRAVVVSSHAVMQAQLLGISVILRRDLQIDVVAAVSSVVPKSSVNKRRDRLLSVLQHAVVVQAVVRVMIGSHVPPMRTSHAWRA